MGKWRKIAIYYDESTLLAAFFYDKIKGVKKLQRRNEDVPGGKRAEG